MCDGLKEVMNVMQVSGDRIPSGYYKKDDVDAVLAEKDEEIDELKESIDQLQKATDSAWSKVNSIYDELRHQKYKRCLAMASIEWLKKLLLCNYPEGILFRRADRRERKWKELAEKFKEAK